MNFGKKSNLTNHTSLSQHNIKEEKSSKNFSSFSYLGITFQLRHYNLFRCTSNKNLFPAESKAIFPDALLRHPFRNKT